jgi:CIC family chloride channel protein
MVGAVVGRAALGDQPSFHAVGFALVSPRELGLYALLGVLCAFWAMGFVKLFYGCEDLAARIGLPPVLKGFGGFALVGVLGVGVPQILGVGYTVMQHVFDRHVPVARAFALAVLEPVATSVTLASGGSGGVFGPSLYTGAMLGDAFGRVVHGLFPSWTAAPAAYGLVAMAALFAAAAEAPITAIVIVFEMSNDYAIVLPLMIATAVATALGRRLIGGTIDDLTLYRRGIDWNRLRVPHALAELPAATGVDTRPFTARGDETVRAVAARMPAEAEGVAVVNGKRLVGAVTAAHLAEWLSREPNAPIWRIARKITPTLSRDDSMERAAELLADSTLAFVPMLDDAGALLGVVNRRQVLEAFRAARSA